MVKLSVVWQPLPPTIGAWHLVMLVLLVLWPAHNAIVALISAHRQAARAVPTAQLLFWIVIPALNEEQVITATVRAALDLDTPATPVRVMVVDDGSDDATPLLLAAIADPRLHVLRRDLPEARQGKGLSLNAAYRAIRAAATAEGNQHRTVLGVIDGDGRMTQASLAEIAAVLGQPRVGAVQCRVRIHNRARIVGLMQDLEFACVADANQIVRDRVGSVGLGGNGQFVMLDELARFADSPWSRCLVEDLELGLRLHLAGVRIRYTPRATITQQGVTNLARLLRQRTRWAHGNLQCARHLSQLIASREVSSIGLLEYLQYLIVPWLTVPISLLVIAVIVITIVGLLAGHPLFGLIAQGQSLPQAVGLWVSLAVFPGLLWGTIHRITLRDEPYPRCLLAGLLYPAFLLIGVLATWRAALHYLTRHNTWDKTERQSEDLQHTARIP